MKKLNYLSLGALCLILLHSCGDAGFGFDVTADFPVTGPVDIPIPGTNVPGDIDVDPDITVINYDLNDVGAFSDALDDLESQGGISPEDIQIIDLSYEIIGIDSNEQLPVEEVSINLNTRNGTYNIPILDGTLQNTPKTEIQLTSAVRSVLLTELRSSSNIDTDIIIDIGSIPSSVSDRNVDFDVKIFFNVLLKVRDLN